MGFPLGISSNNLNEYDRNTETAPNPNPYRFKVIRIKVINKFLIAWVNYPDCTTFEGNKIMIYKDVTLKNFNRWSVLDPHFINDDRSPIVRVRGDKEGWKLATKICLQLSVYDN